MRTSRTRRRVADATGRQSDAAFTRIKSAIVACRLAPGSTFSEVALSARFGLGRAAARAALTRLAQLGLVIPVARHGHTVAPITAQSVHELFELRLALEPRAARLAAGRIDAATLRRLNRSPRGAHSPTDRLSFLASNRAFHRAIASATGNSRLVAVLDAIADEGERLVHLGLFGAGAADTDRAGADHGHEAILAALERGDADAAEAAMREHIEHAWATAAARLGPGAPPVPDGR